MRTIRRLLIVFATAAAGSSCSSGRRCHRRVVHVNCHVHVYTVVVVVVVGRGDDGVGGHGVGGDRSASARVVQVVIAARLVDEVLLGAHERVVLLAQARYGVVLRVAARSSIHIACASHVAAATAAAHHRRHVGHKLIVAVGVAAAIVV